MFADSRRAFMKQLSFLAAAAAAPSLFALDAHGTNAKMRFGLCTYLWGAKAPLDTLLEWCRTTGLEGLELRCQHAHKVEPEISASERADVKKRFADSNVTLVGFGTNEDFHHTDPALLREKIERAKAYLQLSADCGGLGVKVKPNNLPKGVDQKKTTAQIAAALDEVGQCAADLGQMVRLENHGDCAPIPIMKEIIDQVTAPNVGLCWNCNGVDTEGAGFTENFRSVAARLADTVHIHEFSRGTYPYPELFRLFHEIDYRGWLLFECHEEHPLEEIPNQLRTELDRYAKL